MKKRENFIRFDGRLWENMSFKHRSGWETEKIAKRPKEGDGAYQLQLLNKEGNVLVSVSPHVDFNDVCRQNTGELLSTRITAYIPTHPDAKEIVFLRDDLIIFRKKISKSPPKLKINDLIKEKNNKLKISWSAKHSNEKNLSFNVMYIADDGRIFPVVRNHKGSSFVVDISKLVGSKSGKFSILATDGIRSTYVTSDEISIPFKKPLINVKSPRNGEIFAADQPITLSGFVSDIGGKRLPDKGLIWYVNGKKVVEDNWQTAIDKLEPGKHTVEVNYIIEGKVSSKRKINFQIAKRGKKQQEYLKIAKIMREQRHSIGTWPTPEKPDNKNIKK